MAVQPFFHLPNPNPPATPAGMLDAPRGSVLYNPSPYDDEFEGNQLSGKWARSGVARMESYNGKIPSALWMQFASGDNSISFTQYTKIGGDFSATLCCSSELTANFNNMSLNVGDQAGANLIQVQVLYNGGFTIRTVKLVATVFSQIDTTGVIADPHHAQLLLHVQRSGNNWTCYYSMNGVHWVKFPTTTALTLSMDKTGLLVGPAGALARQQASFHWFRVNWLTLT